MVYATDDTGSAITANAKPMKSATRYPRRDARISVESEAAT
jgi:hypothetical protein